LLNPNASVSSEESLRAWFAGFSLSFPLNDGDYVRG
jgi:hypothetical protein